MDECSCGEHDCDCQYEAEVQQGVQDAYSMNNS